MGPGPVIGAARLNRVFHDLLMSQEINWRSYRSFQRVHPSGRTHSLTTGQHSNQLVQPLHKSFPDFITDPSRCDPRFLISPGRLNWELAASCLRLVNNGLEQNLLSLPEYALNSEIQDLQTRISSRISIALQYACRSWLSHLTETREEIPDLVPSLRVFLETKFLAWLEVLSVLGDVGSASVGLEGLILWLQQVCFDVLRYIV